MPQLMNSLHAATLAAVVIFEAAVLAHDGLAARIAALSAQIAQSPSSPSLFVKRAELYRENRQWTEATADLDRAERIDPAIATTSLVRAHVAFDRRQWQAAIAAASRFL